MSKVFGGEEVPYVKDETAINLPLKSAQPLLQVINFALFSDKLHSQAQALPFSMTSFHCQALQDFLKLDMDGFALLDEIQEGFLFF